MSPPEPWPLTQPEVLDEVVDIQRKARRARILGLLAVLALVSGLSATFAFLDPEVLSVQPGRGLVVGRATPVQPGAARDRKVPDGGVLSTVGVLPAGMKEYPVQSRGRVKMSELVAPVEGTLSWTTIPEQVARRGTPVAQVSTEQGFTPVTAGSTGLVMHQAAGSSTVRKGQAVGHILYIEAYVRTLVTGIAPKTTWRCEVASVQANQRAPCRVTGVAPRGTGTLVTATVEPLWFDRAPDVVLRLGPP